MERFHFLFFSFFLFSMIYGLSLDQQNDLKINRDACVKKHLLPCYSNHRCLEWLSDHNFLWKKPDESTTLWSQHRSSSAWKNLQSLGLDRKFIEITLPKFYTLIADSKESTIYYLVDQQGQTQLSCIVKITSGYNYGSCSIVLDKEEEDVSLNFVVNDQELPSLLSIIVSIMFLFIISKIIHYCC